MIIKSRRTVTGSLALASGLSMALALGLAGPASAQFIDATTGPLGDTQASIGVAWGDFDNDGDLDLYVTNTMEGANRLFRNEGGGIFTDVASSLLANAGESFGVAWGDYDNDGDLDLCLANVEGSNRLFRNEGGGVFSDATSGPLASSGGSTGAAWADYDNDGDLDLFIVNFGSPALLRNDGGGTFVDVTSRPISLGSGTYSAVWGDYDNDGDLDLYLPSGSSRLYRNDGGGVFVDVAPLEAPIARPATGGTWGDYDNDGDLDLFITHVDGDACRLLRNDAGVFVDASTPAITAIAGASSAAWGDFDNDGDLDVYVPCYGYPNQLLRNDGGGTFVNVATGALADASVGAGSAWGDYDNDGDLDLYLANFEGANKLFRNDTPAGNHWLQVKLRGTSSNRGGIGARVKVIAGGVTRIREISGGSGMFSQDAMVASFGLGASTTITRLEVRWPSGIVQVVQPVPAVDRVVTVEEPLPPAGQPVQIAAPVPNEGATVRLRHRPGGATSWPATWIDLTRAASGIDYTGTIPGSAVTLRGLEYEVVATVGGSTVRTASRRLRVGLPNQASPTLPDATYQLFSFPFDLASGSLNVLRDDLGDTNSTLWKLGRWDQMLAGGSGGYRSYGDVGTLARKNGYWLIARGGKRVAAAGVSALPDFTADDAGWARIVLQPGWNQIGTPFGFTIDWAGRRESSPSLISDAAWQYSATGGYSMAVALQPWQGYWVLNLSAVAQYIDLPYAEALIGKSAAAPLAAAADRWEARLLLAGGGLLDGAQVLGVRPGASDGRDEHDCDRPPNAPGDWLSVVSLLPGNGAGLAVDYRAPGPSGQRYELLVRGTIATAARIALAVDSALPAGFAAALVDVQGGEVYALPAGGSLVLPRQVRVEGDRYDLLLGPADWIRGEAGEPQAMPARVALAQNYPNPFNPQTTIAFELPAPGRARLQVFNAAGERVALLLDASLSGGRHVLTWDGRDGRGRPAASGQYFYRLESGGVTETKRMMMVR